MSIRKAGGEWVPLMLGIEPEICGVCQEGLYRDTTLFRGGWARCSLCNHFVHYACLASGKVKFLKRRPRVCKHCDEGAPSSTSLSSQSSQKSPSSQESTVG